MPNSEFYLLIYLLIIKLFNDVSSPFFILVFWSSGKIISNDDLANYSHLYKGTVLSLACRDRECTQRKPRRNIVVWPRSGSCICGIYICKITSSRSHWPCSQRRGSAAAGLLGLRVRFPSVSWMSVSFECYMLSGRDLCIAYHSSTGFLTSMVCLSSWRLNNEEDLVH